MCWKQRKVDKMRHLNVWMWLFFGRFDFRNKTHSKSASTEKYQAKKHYWKWTIIRVWEYQQNNQLLKPIFYCSTYLCQLFFHLFLFVCLFVCSFFFSIIFLSTFFRSLCVCMFPQQITQHYIYIYSNRSNTNNLRKTHYQNR